MSPRSAPRADPRTGVRAGLAAVLLAGGLLLVLAAPASAHAVLRAATPADGAVVPEPPAEVTLEFNEPVAAASGGLRVFSPTGERVDAGAVRSDPTGAVLTVGVGELGEGTHVVTFRVTSADGHPVSGAVLFSVGQEGGADEALLAKLFTGQDDRALQVLAAALRWVIYAGLLLAAGGAIFLALVHDRDPAERPALARIVNGAALVTAIATLIAVVVQGALVTGLGLGGALRPAVIGDVLTSGYGASALGRLAGLGLAVLGVRSLWSTTARAVAVAGGVIALAAVGLTGHSQATSPRLVAVGSDVAHTVAAGVWFGGLVLLAVSLRRRRLEDAPVTGARLVARFSTVAGFAVGVVVLAGVGLAWSEVRAVSAMRTTTYGVTLMIKNAVVVAILAAAAYNRRRLVPRIAAAAGAPESVPVPAGGSSVRPPDQPPGGAPTSAEGPAGTATAGSGAAWSALGRTVRMEVLGILVVLGLTAVLVNLVPARTAAGVTGPFSTTVPIGEHLLNLTVDPNRAGVNEFHFYLLTETGRPVEGVDAFDVGFAQPALDIEPIVREPSVAGPAHWSMSGPELSIPGRWTITVTAVIGGFTEAKAVVPIDVGG